MVMFRCTPVSGCRWRALRSVYSASYSRRCVSSNCPEYNPPKVESSWQSHWQKESARATVDNNIAPGQEKFYVLSMFPYPSGRLHMGHVRVYTISDTLAHFYRMRGKKVLHPMGWDSFGLPAENAAIERGINPVDWTQDNIASMRSQLLNLGCHFDWQREVFTCFPDYYKWTQWLFLQLYNHGLAYKKKALVNWDPVDQTVLANEQVDESGCSWRSGAQVEQRYLDQWFFKITDYAESLLQGLEELDWPGSVKLMQSNWIGKSEGAYFDFQVQGIDTAPLKVFTTRPETVFGVSFIAISPEHELLQSTQVIDDTVLQLVKNLQKERILPGHPAALEDRPKQGVSLGLHAVHPFSGASIPVYAADYVLSDYGTKAVMGVPAHDERDYLFAQKHGLPVPQVVEAENGSSSEVLVHSDQFSGMKAQEGGRAMVKYAHSQGFGGHMTEYKLRDWLISRQRYWGAPIPVMYCDKCGTVPVPGEQLPVLLPQDVQFTGRGPSPLIQAHNWLKASCGKPDCYAKRETDTMDTFVDSAWYFLRYINPADSTRPFCVEDAQRWMPVDMYIGGIEHAILHLLYARFISHFLCDIGLLHEREPFRTLLTQGMVQGQTYRLKDSGQYLKPEEQEKLMDGEPTAEVEITWEKMSKSKYNGVDPEDIVKEYGADTVRLFMLFKAPPEAAIQWDIQAIQGAHRWLHRVWRLCTDHIDACRTSAAMEGETEAELKRNIVSATHRAIKQVTYAMEDKRAFNVAVAELMILSNTLRDSPAAICTPEYHQALSALCTMLAPMAPHVASELWELLKEASFSDKHKGTVLQQQWPGYSEQLMQEETIQVVFQVNGKKRGTLEIPAELLGRHDDLEAEVLKQAVQRNLLRDESQIRKVFVASHGRLINFVTN